MRKQSEEEGQGDFEKASEIGLTARKRAWEDEIGTRCGKKRTFHVLTSRCKGKLGRS